MYDPTMLCYITTLTLRYRIGPIENVLDIRQTIQILTGRKCIVIYILT